MALSKEMFTTTATGKNVEKEQDNGISCEKITYTQAGARDAGLCAGSSDALLPKLHSVYLQLRLLIQGDTALQQQRRDETKQNIQEWEAKNVQLYQLIDKEKDRLTHEEKKIDKAQAEINDIWQNPAKITKDSTARAGFIFCTVILILLTIYLFIFYSSAAYSAFFKNFTPDDMSIVNSIFDAQAISRAFYDGITELVLILTIPAVFLGLGFLISSFQKQEGRGKYFKIAGIFITAFLFDFIIAYEIVEKIYDIKRQGDFSENLPEMTVQMAFEQVNFWLIIFAGFVVYIVWGFVYELFMQEHEKMDKVRYAVKVIERKIKAYKIECKDIKDIIGQHNDGIASNNGEINKLRTKLDGVIILVNDVRQDLSNYFAGWINYMKVAGSVNSSIDQCTKIYEQFIEDITEKSTN